MTTNEISIERETAIVEDQKSPIGNDASSIMAVISRAASDPQTDVDKLERLMGLYERIAEKNAKTEYAIAMAEMQKELPVIEERGEIQLGKNGPKYALWEDINETIRPILADHGFSLTFRTGRDGDKISVTGVLTHRAGHSEETTMTLPVDIGPGRNAVQAIGSSTSYGKRYTAIALLNITTHGEDDDGRASGASDCLTVQQYDKLVEMLEDTNSDPIRFVRFMKLDPQKSCTDIPSAFELLKMLSAKKYEDAVRAINEASLRRDAMKK